ncbi:MAG: NAD(P)H-binding protein [Salibacteraceae bacterium]
MKIILTGSIGNIGAPLTQKLVARGNEVTVVSSNAERKAAILALGATAAIGALQDTEFLTATFKGADLVYTLVPPANYFDQQLDLLSYFTELGESFAKAVKQSGVKRVINLSSIGAHLEKGNGILEGTFQVEQRLNRLPEEVYITHIRPVEIYYNLFQYIPLIKHQGIIASNLAADTVNNWVSTEDIADAVVEEIYASTKRRKVKYVASDHTTYQELASTLGEAIGKPDLKWTQITDAQLQENLIGVGMQPQIAVKMTEMYAAIRSGLLYEHYHQHPPASFGKVKMQDFARSFAQAYQQD